MPLLLQLTTITPFPIAHQVCVVYANVRVEIVKLLHLLMAFTPLT